MKIVITTMKDLLTFGALALILWVIVYQYAVDDDPNHFIYITAWMMTALSTMLVAEIKALTSWK